MLENYEITFNRINELKKSVSVDYIWECKVLKEIKGNKEMKDFFNDISEEPGPINPRLAYFGGRLKYLN